MEDRDMLLGSVHMFVEMGEQSNHCSRRLKDQIGGLEGG
jgi:hypothetical protein